MLCRLLVKEFIMKKKKLKLLEKLANSVLEVLGVGEKIVDKSKEGYAEISATPKAVEGIVEYFKEKSIPLDLFTNDKGNPVAK